ncbi:hypothetical protein [Agrobacterium pusense]|uniref:hypothetical protein n=1 Tax=Agrobacterium pusense TaxID=648995 RepID=UPI0024474FEE|nr:hypothetical protein [Agrobacterium pusense]MDH0869775.1 hypothetical protein [Agrobacterium pusense]
MENWDNYHLSNSGVSKTGELDFVPRWATTFEHLAVMGEFEDRNALTRFIKFLSSPTVGDVWLEEAINFDRITAPSPFGEGLLSCSESHYRGVNKLFFRSDSGEKVIVFQSITSVDIIFFPARHVFLAMKHPPTESLEEYYNIFEKILPYLPSKPGKFGGVLISHYFPYHFYSEAVPALERVHALGLLSNCPALYFRKGGAYFDPLVLWPDLIKCEPFEHEDLSKKDDQFFLVHGTAFDQTSLLQMTHAENAYAKVLARSVSLIREGEKKHEFKRVASAGLSIWFGVQASKRSWLGQVEGISSIINELRKEHDELVVVMDGWTSPLYPTATDEKAIAADQSIVAEIMERCPGVEWVSTVGWKSADKAAIASLIDTFVTNFGTGSLHVARLARKPGVGHINTVLDKGDHIHYRTVCLSEGFVTDRIEDASKNADAVSYDLDWKLVLREIKAIIATVGS